MSNSKKDFELGELKAILEDAYAIGEIAYIESIPCDEEELLLESDSLNKLAGSKEVSDVRTSFRVSAEKGQYFLKTVSSWIEDTRLRDVETFIEWNNRRLSLPSPELITSMEGATHIERNGKRYQLFSFIEHNKRYNWMKPEITGSNIGLSGALLAQMHLSAHKFSAEASSGKGVLFQDSPSLAKTADFPFRETFDTLFEHIYAKWTHKHPILNQVRHSNRPLRSGFGMIAHLISSINEERFLTLVHGDFHPGNVLFLRKKSGHIGGAVVDFDHMRWEHPFYDIGYALIMFARKPAINLDTTDVASFGKQQIDWNSARSFIEGYLGELHRSIDCTTLENSFKSKLFSSNSELLGWYMNFGCYLILAWAAEKVSTGPICFSEVYLGALEMSYHMLCDDAFHYAGKIWSKAMTQSYV
ncbi:MAG: hypothetical protein DKT66_11965 [Candidatus Melainabacteria bacterium]|nr:MAG: hypothetical protein DKT66_11965 [Candidatus Melainabacteria bacterium]